MHLQIETINVCNARCCFCPYSTMKRPHGTMPMDLFQKIIDDAATIPPLCEVTLTGLGEPLLDPILMDRFRYVREKVNDDVSLELVTNGSKLTMEIVKEMAEIGVNTILVSLNAVSVYRRKEIMGLDDYDQVRQVCHEAIEFTRHTKTKTKIIVKAVVGKDLFESNETETFTREWGENAFLHLEGNWGGATFPMRIKPIVSCYRALQQIMVLLDGRVSLCCSDAEGEVIFGDLNKQTIREVFNGSLATEYRQKHWNGWRQELKLCKDCTTI